MRGPSLGKEGENCLPLFHKDCNLMLTKFLRFLEIPPKSPAISSEPLVILYGKMGSTFLQDTQVSPAFL